jgi:hypothetical protein
MLMSLRVGSSFQVPVRLGRSSLSRAVVRAPRRSTDAEAAAAMKVTRSTRDRDILLELMRGGRSWRGRVRIRGI